MTITNLKIGKGVEDAAIPKANRTRAIDYTTPRNEAQTPLVRVNPFAGTGNY